MPPVKKGPLRKGYNHLQHEKSPYLQQHATNPVAWYPWGEEAFNQATREKKPVLLSIGYSACHWCHVMAHESFENENIAALMNRYFINIKVDREEYPDIDHLYQTFVQMSTGRGGWPLTVFLTADKIPFYGGTYFPARARYGMISFTELMERIHDVHEREPDKVTQSTSEIKAILESLNRTDAQTDLPDFENAFRNLYRQLEKSFDPDFGGFSSSPKFPHTSDMDFLLNYYHYTGSKKARDMVLFTLKKMGEGGIFDQIGGGFHRYSTDREWLVPHFEKMLYDNALLIPLYVNAFHLSGDEFFRQVAVRTADFILQELYDENSGFYSTLDADSEGGEGIYYLWDHHELETVLDKEAKKLFFDFYDITPRGNFEGKNILHIARPLNSLIKGSSFTVKDAREILQLSSQKLMEIRARRERPALDDKLLLDWNSMMLSALWSLQQISDDVKYTETARRVTDFLLQNYLTSQGGVYHFRKNGKDDIEGYIDDYAWFIQALLDGFDATQDLEKLTQADRLARYVLDNFRDDLSGDFFITPENSRTAFVRMKSNYDSSTPTGSSIMCVNFLRLAVYTGEESYRMAVEAQFRAAGNDLESRGAVMASLLKAACIYYFSPVEITLNSTTDDESNRFIRALNRYFLPQRILIRIASGKVSSILNHELTEGRTMEDKNAVFICHRGTCSLPVFDPDQFTEVFNKLNLNVGE
jgi:uncharacterized protein YyaL (SSP411 family)